MQCEYSEIDICWEIILCATTNAFLLINLTFKRQKSPKFTADGRMHEEIRGQPNVFL